MTSRYGGEPRRASARPEPLAAPREGRLEAAPDHAVVPVELGPHPPDHLGTVRADLVLAALLRPQHLAEIDVLDDTGPLVKASAVLQLPVELRRGRELLDPEIGPRVDVPVSTVERLLQPGWR